MGKRSYQQITNPDPEVPVKQASRTCASCAAPVAIHGGMSVHVANNVYYIHENTCHLPIPLPISKPFERRGTVCIPCVLLALETLNNIHHDRPEAPPAKFRRMRKSDVINSKPLHCPFCDKPVQDVTNIAIFKPQVTFSKGNRICLLDNVPCLLPMNPLVKQPINYIACKPCKLSNKRANLKLSAYILKQRPELISSAPNLSDDSSEEEERQAKDNTKRSGQPCRSSSTLYGYGLTYESILRSGLVPTAGENYPSNTPSSRSRSSAVDDEDDDEWAENAVRATLPRPSVSEVQLKKSAAAAPSQPLPSTANSTLQQNRAMEISDDEGSTIVYPSRLVHGPEPFLDQELEDTQSIHSQHSQPFTLSLDDDEPTQRNPNPDFLEDEAGNVRLSMEDSSSEDESVGGKDEKDEEDSSSSSEEENEDDDEEDDEDEDEEEKSIAKAPSRPVGPPAPPQVTPPNARVKLAATQPFHNNINPLPLHASPTSQRVQAPMNVTPSTQPQQQSQHTSQFQQQPQLPTNHLPIVTNCLVTSLGFVLTEESFITKTISAPVILTSLSFHQLPFKSFHVYDRATAYYRSGKQFLPIEREIDMTALRILDPLADSQMVNFYVLPK